VARLFISHSGRDNIYALAFQSWLAANGWDRDDVFIDLDDIGAGERWRATLVKANVACEALLFLASPGSLDSEECRREVRRAEDDRKEVIVAILRDVSLDDPRLADYRERQIVDLSTNPRQERVEVEHQGQRHFVDFNRAALNAIHAKLIEWGIAPDSFEWPPRHNPKAAPYPGLDAFDEHSAGIFFGREADIMAGIRDLRQIRHRGSPRLLVIQAASGAGKSSFLRAGLWPKLSRTAEFVPLAIVRPATGIITGRNGLGQGLAQWFGAHKRPLAPGTIHAALMQGDAAAGAAALAAYLSQAMALVIDERALGREESAPPPRLSPLIAIDQGEELFAAEDTAESERCLEMLGVLLSSLPDGLDPYVLVTIRADSVDALLQRVPNLGVDTPQTIMLPPLSPAAFRDVITKPAAAYSRQVQRLDLEPALVQTLVDDATGADALPLLAFTLQRLFIDYAPTQRLTLAHYQELEGIAGSIGRKLAEAQAKAGAAGSEESLRRLIVPDLATWDPAASAAKRLVAREADVASGDRAVLAPLADALVEARLLTRGGGTLEVAHEALLRRPPIAGWLDKQKDALKLRDDVLREAKEWADGGRHAEGLVRRGARLEAALALQARADFMSALAPAKDYLAASRSLETAGQRRARRVRAAIYAALLAAIAASQYAIFKGSIDTFVHWNTTVRWYIAETITPHLLSSEREQALKAGESFRECTKACPEMVVIPAGTFVMGSPDGKTPIIGLDGKPKDGPLAPAEKGRDPDEGPQHEVTVATFAAGKHEVTFDDYEECVRLKGCAPVSDSSWGKGRQPVINISWDEAKRYVDWLVRVTGKPYRLLTEAEWEHAARAGTTTVYSFGDDERELCKHANLADPSLKKAEPTYTAIDFCDDGHAAPAPVGSYQANAFGLHDMHGNVFEWTEDCYVNSYRDAPGNGTARWTGECKLRVARGGSWYVHPQSVRAAFRSRATPGIRDFTLGFRVGRSLFPSGTP
jgi:formylglycine-generating enzyme required for sulfatase activity